MKELYFLLDTSRLFIFVVSVSSAFLILSNNDFCDCKYVGCYQLDQIWNLTFRLKLARQEHILCGHGEPRIDFAVAVAGGGGGC